MAISFKCPNCRRAYKAREQDAGKKIKCRNEECKQVIPIPKAEPSANGTAAKPPQQDADALAASMLAEEHKGEQEAASEKINFECPMCGEQHEADAAKQGKNMVCPETGSIIRIPTLKKVDDKPADWREANKRHGILKDDVPQGDDVWSGQGGMVSREALEKVQATPQFQYEPVPLAQRVRTILTVLIVLGPLSGIGYWYFFVRADAKGQADLMARAVEQVQAFGGEKGPPAPPAWHAVVRTAAGRHTLKRAEGEDELEEAKRHFADARGRLRGRSGLAADEAFIRLIEAQVNLGGGGPEVQAQRRIDWNRLQVELRGTLTAWDKADPWALEQGIRAMARGLAPAGKTVVVSRLAAGLARDDPTRRSGLLASAGIEALRADDRDAAEELAEQARAALRKPDGKSATPAPQLQALYIALAGGDVPADRRLMTARTPGAQTAFALGQALLGKPDRAAKLATGGRDPEARLDAALAVAPYMAAGSGEAKALADAALKALTDPQGPAGTGWAWPRVARLCGTAGDAKLADAARRAAPQGLAAWVEFELFRGKLAASGSPLAAAELPEVSDGMEFPSLLARLLWCEHAARLDGAGDLGTAIAGWPEAARPFGNAGLALGLQARD